MYEYLIAILTSGYVEDVISFEKEEEKKWDIKYFWTSF